jgi:hypothetical protein
MLSATRIHKVVVTLAAVTYLFATVGAAGAKVLCFGADGHVAIELAQDAACMSFQPSNPQTSGTDSAEHSDAPSDDHCGSCVDIPLTMDEIAKQPVPLKASALTNRRLASECHLNVFGSRTVCAAGPATETVPSTNATLASLRTVCLLT